MFTTKNNGTKNEIFKAHFAFQKHTDSEENLVHNSPNLKQQLTILWIGLAGVLGSRVWTLDLP